MAQYYNSIKTMKTARIGAIMPWGGDGSTGNTVANIPNGWKTCDGEQLKASDYPLLASEIGKTYGGDMAGSFPDYTGQFYLPKLTNKVMIDLEPEYLSDSAYQYGQGTVADTVVDATGTKFGDLIAGLGTGLYGSSTQIKTAWSADADIDFSLSDPNLKLSGKYTNLATTDPDFQTAISTLGRKLGINHTPSHGHSDSIKTATAQFFGPQMFRSMQVTVSGNSTHDGCPSGVVKSTNHTCAISPNIQQAPSWQNGRTFLTYYADSQHEDTLPVMDKFNEYVSDAGKDYWSQVPAPDWHTGTATRNSPQASTQNVNYVGTTGFTNSFAYTPVKTHALQAWSGLMPRPMVFGNRRNYFGFGKPTYNNLEDNPENPANNFTVTWSGSNSIPATTTEIAFPAGTDIRTSHGTAPNNWTQEDKIHPLQMVDGDSIAKGTYITSIERTGTSYSNYIYTLKLSAATTNISSWQGTLTFKEGTFPTTLSQFGDNDPASTAFQSHNHGTFDIEMDGGSMKPPASHPMNDISIGSVTPQSLDNALNIIVDTDQPSMVVVYLIKAF